MKQLLAATLAAISDDPASATAQSAEFASVTA